MIKTLTNLFKQDKEKFVVPKGVQDVIPVAAIFDDGIFKVGKDKYSKTYRFTDINYAVASREDTLGHKDITTTLNIYTDVTKELKRTEFDGLDKYFNNSIA